MDLRDVSSTGARVLGFNLVDREAMSSSDEESSSPLLFPPVSSSAHAALLRRSHRAALLHDGLSLLAEGVAALTRARNQTDTEEEEEEEEVDLSPPRISCSDRDAPFEMGERLMRAILEVRNLACWKLLQRELVAIYPFFGKKDNGKLFCFLTCISSSDIEKHHGRRHA